VKSLDIEPQTGLPHSGQKGKKRLLFLAKASVSLGLLYLVTQQIELTTVVNTIKTVHLPWLLSSAFLFFITQCISAMRMRYYITVLGAHINQLLSFKLYFVGMLLNQLLPGGIGGDGYKAWFMWKKMGLGMKQSIQSQLSNRANGLLWLCLITACMLPFSEKAMSFLPMWLILLGTLITIVSYAILSHHVLNEPIKIQLLASRYSFLVQLLNLVCAALILKSLGITLPATDYLIVFMLACIVGVLPLSVGGIGVREYTFVVAAKLFTLDATIGVSLSILYYVVTFATSLIGFFTWPSLRKAEITSFFRKT
jgi:glycosyltransferase 2 family protein